jgi:hypothetical protein
MVEHLEIFNWLNAFTCDKFCRYLNTFVVFLNKGRSGRTQNRTEGFIFSQRDSVTTNIGSQTYRSGQN